MHSKVEVVACRNAKVNTTFIAVVSVHVPKYISGQHLYEQADACTAKWKPWRAGLRKQLLHLQLLCVFMFPNMFLGGISMNEKIHAQQSVSCSIQDYKNKYFIYRCWVCSCSHIYFWAASL